MIGSSTPTSDWRVIRDSPACFALAAYSVGSLTGAGSLTDSHRPNYKHCGAESRRDAKPVSSTRKIRPSHRKFPSSAMISCFDAPMGPMTKSEPISIVKPE
jgi:hypothetical protein